RGATPPREGDRRASWTYRRDRVGWGPNEFAARLATSARVARGEERGAAAARPKAAFSPLAFLAFLACLAVNSLHWGGAARAWGGPRSGGIPGGWAQIWAA